MFNYKISIQLKTFSHFSISIRPCTRVKEREKTLTRDGNEVLVLCGLCGSSAMSVLNYVSCCVLSTDEESCGMTLAAHAYKPRLHLHDTLL